MQPSRPAKQSRALRRPIGRPRALGMWIVVMGAVLTGCNVDSSTYGDEPPSSQLVGASLTHPELRDELLEMMASDQLERTGWDGLPEGTPLPPSQDYVRAVRLEKIVDDFGWPTFDMVGKDGSTAAWVVAQHSDFVVDLQVTFLALIEAAVEEGQADETEMAYLWDRVAVNQGLPQRYGSQIRCRMGLPAPATPIKDADEVDTRRDNVGMSSLATYYEELSVMCAQEEAEGVGPDG